MRLFIGITIFFILILGVGFFILHQRAPSEIEQDTTPITIHTPSPTPTPMPTQTPSITPISDTVRVTLHTTVGDIVLELDGTRAPYTVGNFVSLANQNFYDGVTFHRVIPDFMIQTGDPLSKDPEKRSVHGTGGPGYAFQDEINEERLVRGSVAMANAGPNTNGSQFFIVTAEATPWLDGRHTNFGTVIQGMDIINTIAQVERDRNDNPLEPVTIERVTIQSAE